MRRQIRYSLLTAVLLWVGTDSTAAQSGPASAPACSVALRPGRWQSRGGNVFWIQCVGNEVFWLGMNRKHDSVQQGSSWTQVGHGTVRGRVVDLVWSDIPYGTIMTGGRIQLRLEADTLLRLTRDDGPFGEPGLHWVASK